MRHNRKQNTRTVRKLPNGYRLRQPLTWWRYAVLRQIEGKDQERFTSALRTGSAAILTSAEIEAGIARGDEALRIAVRLHPYPDHNREQTDLAISWFIQAFVSGQHVAALVIAEAVRQMLSYSKGLPWAPIPDNEEQDKLRRRMHEWYGCFSAVRLLQEPEEYLVPLLERSGAVAAQSTQHTLTPVGEIPLDGRYGKDIAKRYQPLTQPMPLLRAAIDPNHMEVILATEMPWCTEAIAAIADDLRLQALGSVPIARFRPLLLLGSPGIGKTRFVNRLAKHLGLPFRWMACSSTRGYDIAGISRVYESTQPGIVPRVMLESGIANPIILLDEIEKSPLPGHERSLMDVLLPMLESETARTVPDECLSCPVDMSAVSWAFTANDIRSLPEAFLDRVRIVEMKRPDPSHLPRIIEAILSDLAEYHAIPTEALPTLSDAAVKALTAAYADGASIRVIKRSIAAALASQLRPAPTH